MTVIIQGDHADRLPAMHGRGTVRSELHGIRAGRDRTIEIGLVNNMPDPALEVTERQFVNLLAAAAGDLTISVHLFSLPAIPRGEAARSRLKSAYTCATELRTKGLDALIVTGTEPRAASLELEPYWSGFADLIDWAEHNTISTIWSCLAAHAAVFHLDAIRRRALSDKRFGLFDCETTPRAGVLAGLPPIVHFPHSRWNELRESDLVAHGYDILTRSPTAGVDVFVKKWRSLFVFFQGHPEYDAGTLLREYRRDIRRFLRGERDRFPSMPKGYFCNRGERALRALEARSRMGRRSDLLAAFPENLVVRSRRVRSWQASAKTLLGNWLSYIASQKL
jgi:homoserine O-succinyltransferase/O-acetyltransferase